MSEKRGDLRTAFRASVRLEHPDAGEHEVVTRDMSHSGLFLVWSKPFDIRAGDVVTVQSLDIDDAPLIRARVVRVESGGIAVMYLLDE
jgi:hypothetical protein